MVPVPAPDPVIPLSGVDQWAELALAELTDIPDVSRVGIAVVEGGGRRLLFTASDRLRGATHDWCHIDAFAAVPLNDAMATRTALTGPIGGLDARYAEFVAAQHGTGFVDIAAVPFAAEGAAVGGFVLYYSQTQRFDAAQLASLNDVADRIESHLRAALRRPGSPAIPELVSHHGSLVAEHDVPPDPAAVSEARRFLRETLTGWRIDEEATDHAVLCLSELATNALIHTGGGCRVQVELHDGVLTTRVHDNGSTLAPPMTRPGDLMPGHGHGLRIVESLVSRWGRTTDAHSAAVWFALDVS